MPVAYQMPVCVDLGKKVGPKMWWKPILRKGRIVKNGVELNVDDDLYANLIRNFKAGVKDQVQFLAGHANDSDLEAFRGDLMGLEARPDGKLWGLFSATDRGDATLAENPKLGASVSVDLDFKRADGRNCGPTLLHVAGCFDPEIGRLGDWVRAELAASHDQVIDLTAADAAPDVPAAGVDSPAEPGGPHPTEEEEAGLMPAPAPLTDDELATLRALLARIDTPTEPAPADEPETPEVVDDTADADEDADVDEPELVAASAAEAEALQLANARLDAQAIELAALRAERDAERYERDRDRFAREFGIPPAITDLCRPWLTGARTVQLSSGENRDPGADIRRLLEEFGRVAKLLDLSGPVGSAHELSAADAERSERDAFIDQARASGFAR